MHWSKNPEMKAKVLAKLAKTLFKPGEPSWNTGKKGWFPHDKHGFYSGHTPWNKDTHIRTNTGRTHFKKGQRSPRWKGGVSKIYERIHTSTETKLWREEVFRRDKWTCQMCGFRGDVEAHHIIPVNELLNRVSIKDISFEDKLSLVLAIPEMTDPANGMTFCKQCHYSKHKRRVKNEKN